MITVNSISGGKTSAYMAIHYKTDINIFSCVCIEHEPSKPKDKAVLNYALNKLNGNFIASAEREMTLKVLMDLEQTLGTPIIWVRGKSFDQIIDENSALPTWKRRFCTTELKIIPIFEYLYPRYGKTLHNIGFRADERERILNAKNERTIRTAISCKNFGKHYLNWAEIDWQKKNFPLKTTFHYQIKNYLKEFHPNLKFPWDSNCVGCHHKPQELINFNYRDEPEILNWFSMQEKKKFAQGKKNRTWQDSKITYEQIFHKNYSNLFSEISDFTMCNSGGCTD